MSEPEVVYEDRAVIIRRGGTKSTQSSLYPRRIDQ
jgi:hypothetical protein